MRLPLAALVGGAVAYGTHWYIVDRGLTDEPAPPTLWLWIALTGMAASVLILGWRGVRNWRRGAMLLAVPACLLSGALVLNLWVGYFPTVQTAWNQLISGPLPDQTDQATVAAMVASGARPPHGSVVPVSIPSDASHFKHRGELVYLPPEWFASNPPPRLPAVMMIGGQFNTPADWTRAGNAVRTLDAFAAKHQGKAPVLVFVDSGGAFNNDTECVNGARGNAADHLTKDVVPYMISHFGVSPDRSGLGRGGLVHGRDLRGGPDRHAPRHVQRIRRRVRRLFPECGKQGANHRQAVRRKRRRVGRIRSDHGDRPGTARTPGWPVGSRSRRTARQSTRHDIGTADTGTMRLAGRDAATNPSNQTAAAYSLCALGRANGIDCAVVPSRASTTGRSRSTCSRLRCRGWPASWAPREFRGFRSPTRRPLRRPRGRRWSRRSIRSPLRDSPRPQ